MRSEISRLYEQVKQQRRIIYCTPADEQRIRAAVAALPTSGLFKVRASPMVPAGQMYVAKPDPLFYDWDADEDEGIDVDQVEMEERDGRGWLGRWLGRMFGKDHTA